MDIELEEVVDRVGQGNRAILCCRVSIFECKRCAGLLAGVERDVLEVAIGIGDLLAVSESIF